MKRSFCILMAFGYCVATYFLMSSIFIQMAAASVEGSYLNESTKEVELKLEGGHFSIWLMKNGHRFLVKAGKYKVSGNVVHFLAKYDDSTGIGDSEGKLIDACRLKWEGGIFLKKRCQEKGPLQGVSGISKPIHAESAVTANVPQDSFPKEWKIVKKKGFAVYVPVDATLHVKNDGLNVLFRGSSAGLKAIIANGNNVIHEIIAKCRPVNRLSRGENNQFLFCAPDSGYAYLDMVTKGQPVRIFSYVLAKNFNHLKVLSIALASVKQSVTAHGGAASVSYHKWSPRDGSFSVDVPQGWMADGGTADFGRNGYIRIVKVASPDGRKQFVGVYSPLYEYVQMGYMQSGYPPMEPQDYIANSFFQFIANNYNIVFENVKIDSFHFDENMSNMLNSQNRQYGLSAKDEVFYANGSCSLDGNAQELVIQGIMNYLYLEMAVIWGPAPIVVLTAPRGEMKNWLGILTHVANSWQVNPQWLIAHSRYARRDMKKTLEGFRRVNKILQQQEQMLNQSFEEYDEQSNLDMEIFWDNYHALGGEERYDNPTTGEEIDVPTGADKYLYDQYSQTWVGIKMDQENAQELMQHLKERGFVELVPHTY